MPKTQAQSNPHPTPLSVDNSEQQYFLTLKDSHPRPFGQWPLVQVGLEYEVVYEGFNAIRPSLQTGLNAFAEIVRNRVLTLDV